MRYRSDSPGRKARFTDSPDSLDWQIQVQRTFRFCAIWQSGESGESGETSDNRRKEQSKWQRNSAASRPDAGRRSSSASSSGRSWSDAQCSARASASASTDPSVGSARPFGEDRATLCRNPPDPLGTTKGPFGLGRRTLCRARMRVRQRVCKSTAKGR